MKVYLSGPMTGLPEKNFPAFMEAAEQIRALGHEVYNPAEYENGLEDGEPFVLAEAFAEYTEYICREAEAVVVLPRWERSPGALAEVSLCRAIGKPWYRLDEVLDGVLSDR